MVGNIMFSNIPMNDITLTVDYHSRPTTHGSIRQE